ncbi:hypothetical protein Tco_0072066 [Tanacetum coccineum]
MLRKFDRQDLVDFHRLVMKRFEDTTPEGYNLLLWGDLKVMFEPNVEDEIWSNQHGLAGMRSRERGILGGGSVGVEGRCGWGGQERDVGSGS